MKHVKTYEEMNEDSLEDLKTKINDYFDENNTDGVYTLLTVLKNEDPDSYEEYKEKYDKLK